MPRWLPIVLVILVPLAARADASGEIDWQRRVLKATGQGAPDLNAPSIAVARLGAERAAMAIAQRNALETLKGATLESGGTVGTLLQNDGALRSKVQGKLRGVRAVKTHYFSDGGVSLDVEVPLDQLPAEIGQNLTPPAGTPKSSPSTSTSTSTSPSTSSSPSRLPSTSRSNSSSPSTPDAGAK